MGVCVFLIICACVRVHILDVYAVIKEAKTPQAGDRVPSFCLSFWTLPHPTLCPSAPCVRGALKM